jgi:hypothetical protein
MATSNNSTSLYSFTPSTTVSTNNFTTLYNATPGVVTTANVPDRNFTTLYTQQTDIQPTYPYGNSNVEAFLNVGSDPGGNVVQNIVMSGNLNVGSQSNLGNVGNVHITGGSLNYILETDGSGGLNWVPLPSFTANTTLYIHFDVVSTGNNQLFTNGNLIVYANSNTMAVMKNGINIEPSQYSISGSTLTINIPLSTGDTIDVLPSTNSSGNSQPGGNLTEVQYNGGSTLSGNTSFTFDQANSRLTVTNINAGLINASANINTLVVNQNSYLGSNSNVHIYGGNVGEVLGTDGTGNLSWITGGGGGGNGVPGGSNSTVQYNDNGNFNGSSNFTFNEVTNTLSATNIVGNVATANYSNFSGSATTATSATTAGSAISANIANYAVNVTGNSQPNITTIGQLSNLLVSTGTVDFINASNVSLGSVGNLHITGGSGGQYLSTDGSGGLSWSAVSVTSANYANYAGTVVNNNQSNITTVGTLTSLTVTGNINTSNYFVGNGYYLSVSNSLVAGTVYTNSQPNITSVGTLTSLTVTGNITTSNYFVGNGAYITGISSTNANYSNYAGTIINSTQSNITSLGTLTSLNVVGAVQFSGNVIVTGASSGDLRVDGNLDSRNFTSVRTAFEKFNIAGAAGGTQSIFIDVASVYYANVAATSNIQLNITSFASTFDSSLANGQSSTVAFVNTVGTTPYVVTIVRIDGVAQTVKYVNGVNPTVGTRLSNCVQSYTYTMLKTGTATYTVLGSLTEYQ